jgi:hypothetical protein
LHHVWDVAWDTPYGFLDASEFSCAHNRGLRGNPLFLLNHWVNAGGLPSEDSAMAVNGLDVLYGRAQSCIEESGRVPNFVAVDFYEHGALFETVDRLNQL